MQGLRMPTINQNPITQRIMSTAKMVTETTYQVIIEGQKSGYLKKLMDKGILSFTPVVHKDIYEHLLKEVENCERDRVPSPISQAVHNTSAHFGIAESSVWRLKKSMES